MFYNSLLTSTGGSSAVSIILMVVLFIGVFYFFGIRPQKKQEREAMQMRNSLMVGDEITTIGGIIGKIVSIKEETMVIETTRDHTRIRLLKSAVRSVDVRVEEARAAKMAQEAPTEEIESK
ncbi:MAG: preprotein translocase subunit YajC [Clostridia bacterium]|nr:preprotein translocase subunit YajC [Clostridia bacterium]